MLNFYVLAYFLILTVDQGESCQNKSRPPCKHTSTIWHLSVEFAFERDNWSLFERLWAERL